MHSPPAMPRVALLDDHLLFCDALRAVLASEEDIAIVLQAHSGRDLMPAIDAAAFDLLVLDVVLPGSNGLAVLRELRRRKHAAPALVLTSYARLDLVREALAAGAHGYALKSQSAVEIVGAIRRVAAGERYLAPMLATAQSLHTDRQADPFRALSPREREVFDLLVRGYSIRQIAEELFISVKTADTHRQRIMDKLVAHSTVELIRLAVRNGVAL